MVSPRFVLDVDVDGGVKVDVVDVVIVVVQKDAITNQPNRYHYPSRSLLVDLYRIRVTLCMDRMDQEEKFVVVVVDDRWYQKRIESFRGYCCCCG